MAGRPRKPLSTKHLEGNRGKRDLPKFVAGNGLPEMPEGLTEEGNRFWKLAAGELGAMGVAKRIDTDGLKLLAELWELSQMLYQIKEVDRFCKVVARWQSLAGKFGMTPADRERLTIAAKEKPDEIEERYFKVTG